MAGLRNICKAFGQMKIQGVLWVWDYANDEPVLATEMPEGSERWKTSERIRWTAEKMEAQDAAKRDGEPEF